MELAREVSNRNFHGGIKVVTVPFGTPLEKRLRGITSLKVKGFILTEQRCGHVVRFKHLKGIWKHFRDPEKEVQYLKKAFSDFMNHSTSQEVK